MASRHSNHFLAKNVLWNFFGFGSPLLIGVVTIPHLIAQLGTARFGILTIIWMFNSYTNLLDLGLGRVITYQLSVQLVNLDAKRSANLVWTAAILLVIFGAIAGIILSLLAPWLVYHVIRIPSADVFDTLHAFYILAATFPFIVATNCARGVLESHQAFSFVNTVRIMMGVFIFVGPLLALSIHNSLAFITLILMIGKIASFLLYFYFCYRVMPNLFQRFTIVISDIVQLVRLGAWVTVSNIVNALIGHLDRFFIAGISMSAVAYYVTPNEIVTKLWLIPGSITAVLFPEFSATLVNDLKRTRILFQQGIKYIFFILFPFVFVLIYFAYDLLDLWLGEEFAQAGYRILQWLALGVLMNSIAHIPNMLIQAKGKMHLTGKLDLIELPFYGLALWLIVPYGNMEVFAMVWFIRMMIDCIVILLLAHKILEVTLSRELLLNMSAMFGVLVMGFYLNTLSGKLFAMFITIILLTMMLPRLKLTILKAITLPERS